MYLCTDPNNPTGRVVDSTDPPAKCRAFPGVAEVGWTFSGGGFSDVFSRPGYQDSLPAGSTAIGAMRGVPDVGLQASAGTGALVYLSLPPDGRSGLICGSAPCSTGWDDIRGPATPARGTGGRRPAHGGQWIDRASGGGEAIVVGPAMVEAALRYAAMGWPVFPCAPRSKVPLFANPHPRHGVARYRCRGYRDCGRLGHGVLDATTDPDLITGPMWGRCPTANIAVACGRPGPDVIDFDVAAGQPGLARFAPPRAARLLP